MISTTEEQISTTEEQEVPSRSRGRRNKLLAGYVLGAVIALVGTIGVIAPPAQAAAGSAVAFLNYDPNISQYTYKCAYAGWGVGPTKTYSCKLETYDGYQYANRTGTFTGSSHTTPLTSFKRTNTVMCVVAKASYSGGSDTDRVCN